MGEFDNLFGQAFLCSTLPPILSNLGELKMRDWKEFKPLQISPPPSLKNFQTR